MTDTIAVLNGGSGGVDGGHGIEATRRRLSPRQAEVVAQLVQATVDEVEAVGYAGLTVRNVARRAGVAPATAYNYFSSKDHLLAEVLWRGMQALPAVDTDAGRSVHDRVTDAVRAMVLLTTESAALVDASTQALLSSNPDVKHLRDLIGNQIHRRLGRGRRSRGRSDGGAGAADLVFGGAPRGRDGPPVLHGHPRVPGRGDHADDRVGDPGEPGPAMTLAEPVSYSPYAYEIHEDPYPVYARLRAEAPVYRNDELDFWALSRHEDVLAAFRNLDGFSNASGVSLEPSAFGPDAHKFMSFLALDPPRHTRMRSLVGKGFTPSKVAEMEEHIRAIALEHLEPALERGSFDFIADFAGKLPMDVISELVGVPRADRVEIRRLADLVVHREDGVLDVPPAGMEAAFALVGYYQGMVDERRKSRTDDLTSALLDAEIDGDKLSDDEIIAFLFLMVVAGNETTTKLLGNAWYWGWRNPDERAKPFTDRERVVSWIEETLRYDTSSQMLLRVARVPMELHGTRIPEGDRVLLLVGSANRDEAVFPEADRYDLDRDTGRLVSFGSGRHFCMGAPLARLEARVALSELVERVATYDVDPDGIERVHSINVRGLAALPTAVTLR